jgi:uncharacterized protein YcfL
MDFLVSLVFQKQLQQADVPLLLLLVECSVESTHQGQNDEQYIVMKSSKILGH